MSNRNLKYHTPSRPQSEEASELLSEAQPVRYSFLGADICLPIGILIMITVWAMIETLSDMGMNALSIGAFAAETALVACAVMGFFEINKRGRFG